jgi:hypothetical protein
LVRGGRSRFGFHCTFFCFGFAGGLTEQQVQARQQLPHFGLIEHRGLDLQNRGRVGNQRGVRLELLGMALGFGRNDAERCREGNVD